MDAKSCAMPAVGRTGGAAVCPKAGVAAANIANKRKTRGGTLMISSRFVIRPSATRNSSVDLAESEREARQRRCGERSLWPAFHARCPSVAARAGMHPGGALVGVDDPKLSDTVARVKSRLETLVVGEARGGNLDNKIGFAGIKLGEPHRRFLEQLLGKNRNVRLKHNCIGQLQCCLDADRQVVRQSPGDCDKQG